MKDVGAQITLKSSPKSSDTGVLHVCPDDEVTFTCETNGSTILAWTSEEYIGTGGSELELTTGNTPGFKLRSNSDHNTVATLISKDQRLLAIASTLEIVTSSDLNMSHSSSVTCKHRTNSANKTITLQHLGMPHNNIMIILFYYYFDFVLHQSGIICTQDGNNHNAHL